MEQFLYGTSTIYNIFKKEVGYVDDETIRLVASYEKEFGPLEVNINHFILQICIDHLNPKWKKKMTIF
jgi:hypothetical protein